MSTDGAAGALIAYHWSELVEQLQVLGTCLVGQFVGVVAIGNPQRARYAYKFTKTEFDMKHVVAEDNNTP